MKNIRLVVLYCCTFLGILACNKSAKTEQTEVSQPDSTSETSHSASTGIQFFEGTFTEAQAKAKAENKKIFMDCYTSWCGPCKALKANVFPDETLGKLINEKYIAVAYDMEAGEGPEIATKYNIEAYPTLLFLDAEGKVLQTALGYREAPEIAQIANELSK
jgi:thioredoxin 1